jgi:DNA-binding CsgD family transcriptional regulator
MALKEGTPSNKEYRLNTDSICLFVNFLKNPSLNYSEICSFLVHNIFAINKFSSGIISHVSKSGLINISGSFGVSVENLSNWNNIDQAGSHPLAITLKENKLTLINTLPKWPKGYSESELLNIDEYFKTFLCLPIAKNNSLFGTLSIFSSQILKISKQELEFYSIIANMVVLRFDHKEDLRHLNLINSNMNTREISIVELIKLGKNNAEIAKALGYSESTIRQDTIKIYRKLGISGRQEIYFLKEIS